jgi:hypothetical protein
MLIHNDGRVEVPKGMFTRKGGLESGKSFLQAKASMTRQEKVKESQSAVCVT